MTQLGRKGLKFVIFVFSKLNFYVSNCYCEVKSKITKNYQYFY